MEFGEVILWLVMYAALTLAGLPVAAALFPDFDDRGATVALPISLSVVTAVVYWLGRVRFDSVTVFAGLVALGVLAVAAARYADVSWSGYAETMAVFTAAFALLVAVRAADPAVHAAGGEKFLDYGLLKSLLRATALPPEDMWFAGEAVQYYYGGHLVAAVLTTLTGTAANYAYNLALAGFYAMLVTAAYGLAGAIAAGHGTSRRTAGVLAAFFIGFASNLYTVARLLLEALPDGVAGFVAGTLGLAPESAALSPANFSYWSASRVIPNTINEFPLFAFLNGDLHAHMMSTPFLLLVATLCYGYYRTPATEPTRRRALVLGTTPVIGLLAVINTWSFPSGIGITVLALLFAPAHPLTLLPQSVRNRLGVELRDEEVGSAWTRREASRLLGALGFAVAVGVLAVAWVAPFFLSTASGRALAFFPERSGIGVLLLVHGAFLFVFAVYLLPKARSLVRTDEAERLVVVGALLGAFGWLGNYAAVILVAPLLLLAWILLRNDGDVGYESVLLVAGAGLVLIVEFAYVEEQAAPERMNTVFKVYMQVWVFWAVATGAALARILSQGIPTGKLSLPLSRRQLASVFVAGLMVSVSFYGAFALANHFQRADDYTLDATRFAETSHPAEAEAIAWMDREIAGQPNIVSAPGVGGAHGGDGIYGWVNAPSSFTGIPTVAGWVHEVGYRNGTAYYDRVADVETMYTGTWAERTRLYAAYDVKYVYVGPEERERYGEQNLARRTGVSVAFQNYNVTIYEIDHSAL